MCKIANGCALQHCHRWLAVMQYSYDSQAVYCIRINSIHIFLAFRKKNVKCHWHALYNLVNITFSWYLTFSGLGDAILLGPQVRIFLFLLFVYCYNIYDTFLSLRKSEILSYWQNGWTKNFFLEQFQLTFMVSVSKLSFLCGCIAKLCAKF